MFTKYKAFIPELKQFHDVVAIRYENGAVKEFDVTLPTEVKIYTPGTANIITYTGLTDMNKAELWEDDIIFYPEWRAKYKIVWYDPWSSWITQDSLGKPYRCLGSWEKFYQRLGNEVETPDLLSRAGM